MEQTVERKSFLFAVRIVKLSNHLNTTKKEYVLSKQRTTCPKQNLRQFTVIAEN